MIKNYSTQEVASLLHIEKRTLQNRISAQNRAMQSANPEAIEAAAKLVPPSFKIGKIRLFPARQLELWLARFSNNVQ
ncbi:DNA-binding protein [Shewanella chilikensis]|uniref:DNA-binding protein n=1 Tax=Shewanella chilikensis TaxID=558541 RepID=UPI000470F844